MPCPYFMQSFGSKYMQIFNPYAYVDTDSFAKYTMHILNLFEWYKESFSTNGPSLKLGFIRTQACNRQAWPSQNLGSLLDLHLDKDSDCSILFLALDLGPCRCLNLEFRPCSIQRVMCGMVDFHQAKVDPMVTYCG